MLIFKKSFIGKIAFISIILLNSVLIGFSEESFERCNTLLITKDLSSSYIRFESGFGFSITPILVTDIERSFSQVGLVRMRIYFDESYITPRGDEFYITYDSFKKFAASVTKMLEYPLRKGESFLYEADNAFVLVFSGGSADLVVNNSYSSHSHSIFSSGRYSSVYHNRYSLSREQLESVLGIMDALINQLEYFREPKDIVLETILVEGGTFIMGDEFGDLWDDCRPTHKVTFTYDFYMGKYETTFDEYDAFCNATGRSKPYDYGWGRGSRPVNNVSWNDAIAYCNWLSEKEGLPKAYDDKGNLLDQDGMITTDPSKVLGYRLPTEAEWEYAARGGNKSRGYKYAGSDNVDDVAWYKDNSDTKTPEVGNKAPNELGIYDMSGNVWEWCSDWKGNYSSSAQTNPYNSTAGSARVHRGGGWYSSALVVRVANRGGDSPAGTGSDLGFRIARTVH